MPCLDYKSTLGTLGHLDTSLSWLNGRVFQFLLPISISQTSKPLRQGYHSATVGYINASHSPLNNNLAACHTIFNLCKEYTYIYFCFFLNLYFYTYQLICEALPPSCS